MTEYTPSWFDVREEAQHVTSWTADELDRMIARERAQAVKDAAAIFIDWDILYGHSPETDECRRDMEAVDALMRYAKQMEGD